MDINKEREAFERFKAEKIGIAYDELKTDLDDCERRFGKRYVGWNFSDDWELWQAAKAQAVPEGFVLVSQDKAKDTDRLNFLLGDDRYIRTVVHRDIQNEDFEKIGEHYLFAEVYWIDGWDYHENSSSQSERGAIDKAMLESQEPAND